MYHALGPRSEILDVSVFRACSVNILRGVDSSEQSLRLQTASFIITVNEANSGASVFFTPLEQQEISTHL